MNKKSRRPAQGILKTGVLVPITDPAEQAALDRLFERRKTRRLLVSPHGKDKIPKRENALDKELN
jgi:hypothetical protein